MLEIDIKYILLYEPYRIFLLLVENCITKCWHATLCKTLPTDVHHTTFVDVV